MLEYLAHYRIPFIAVLTKADKLKPTQREHAKADFAVHQGLAGKAEIILTSAESGAGMEELRQHILEAVNKRMADMSGESI